MLGALTDAAPISRMTVLNVGLALVAAGLFVFGLLRMVRTTRKGARRWLQLPFLLLGFAAAFYIVGMVIRDFTLGGRVVWTDMYTGLLIKWLMGQVVALVLQLICAGKHKKEG